MRKFLTLLKPLTAFPNLRVRNAHQPKTLSVAYCNPAWDCSESTTTTTPVTNNFTYELHDDSAPAGSFFFSPRKNFVLVLMKEKGTVSGRESAASSQQLESDKQEAEQRFFELLSLNHSARNKRIQKASIKKNFHLPFNNER